MVAANIGIRWGKMDRNQGLEPEKKWDLGCSRNHSNIVLIFCRWITWVSEIWPSVLISGFPSCWMVWLCGMWLWWPLHRCLPVFPHFSGSDPTMPHTLLPVKFLSFCGYFCLSLESLLCVRDGTSPAFWLPDPDSKESCVGEKDPVGPVAHSETQGNAMLGCKAIYMSCNC